MPCADYLNIVVVINNSVCVGTIFWSCRWLMAAGKRPVPFRTRLAKPARADGTAPGRVWESRLPPAYNFIFLCVVGVCCCGTYSPHFFVLVGVCTTCVGVWCGSGLEVCAPDSCFACQCRCVLPVGVHGLRECGLWDPRGGDTGTQFCWLFVVHTQVVQGCVVCHCVYG